MIVTVLGSGTSQGVPVIACPCEVCRSADVRDKRLRSAVLVETQGRVLLIDTGPDFRQQMLTAGVTRLDAVLFTHGHKDHLAGLDDVRAFNYIQKGPVDVYAEERVQKVLQQEFSYVFSEKRYPGVPDVCLHTITTDTFVVKGVEVVPIRAMHMNLPVLGFRFGTFAYLTDANLIPDEEMHKLQGLDCLIINGLRKSKHISHFALSEAVDIINGVGAKQGYITHISHQMGFHAQVEQELPRHIGLVYDGLRISFP